MKKLNLLLTAAAMVVFSVQAFAQEVTGTVKDEAGNPVVGATVMVEGTTIGTTADVDGRWSLKPVADGAVLNASFLGYENQSIVVGGVDSSTILYSKRVRSI